MPTYVRFEDLPVWQQAKALVVAVYRAANREPFRKDFGFVNQITRAALSVVSNIAEGHERGTTKEFVHLLHVARGSCGEVRCQLLVAKELGYLGDGDFEELHRLCLDTSRQLAGFVDYLKNHQPSADANSRV